MRTNNMFRLWVILVLFWMVPTKMVFGLESGVIKFYLGILEDASQRSTTFNEWIDLLPGAAENKKQIRSVAREMGVLKEKKPAIYFDYQNNEIQWKDNGAHSTAKMKLISIKPLRFRLNGNEGVIEDSNPTVQQLYEVLAKTYPVHHVNWFLKYLVPSAEAKSKSLLKKLMIPLIVLNVIGLAYAGYEIKQIFDKVDDLEKRYKTENKDIAPVLQRINQTREKNPNSYNVTGADCKKTVENAPLNPFAKPGEKGYQYFGLNSLRLTPKSKKFGQNDVEIFYTNKDGIQEISEIKVHRYPNSKDSKNPFENDCLMYSAAIKNSENRFLKTCADKYFPGQNVTSLELFYKALLPFDLKDHELMAKKEPGCQHLLAWASGTPNLAPKPYQAGDEDPSQAK